MKNFPFSDGAVSCSYKIHGQNPQPLLNSNMYVFGFIIRPRERPEIAVKCTLVRVFFKENIYRVCGVPFVISCIPRIACIIDTQQLVRSRF